MMNMENKINIAELLKDCPSGMKLDSPMFEGLELEHVNKFGGTHPIVCRVKTSCGDYNYHIFTKYGCYNDEPYSKCVIFPKGKTTWEGFQRPFKDGDVVACKLRDSNLIAFIYRERKNTTCVRSHFTLYAKNTDFSVGNDVALKEEELRFATEEEKQKLFQAIEEHGYRWNVETKTLGELVASKFKVGDVVQLSKQDCWELVQNKFDITTLKPFESRVLVRNYNGIPWKPAIYGFSDSKGSYVVGGLQWKQCIPYEGNEDLLGTTNDCDEFYKNWE